ncbi:MAG: hypothetical protein ACK5B6_03320 [Bacteroidia bacterium]|jgi:hypothetical protein
MIHFEEKQPFHKNSLIWVGIVGMVPPIIIEVSKAVKEGSGSFENVALLIFIEALVFTFLFTSRLETKLDEHGISYRLFPFHLKTRFIAWDEINNAQVRKYDPLGEYWGWGIKGTRKNRAINIAGDIGLQLELKNGRKLLIGTLQKEKMERVVEKIQSANLVQ